MEKIEYSAIRMTLNISSLPMSVIVALEHEGFLNMEGED
jgi:hypothetical protein